MKTGIEKSESLGIPWCVNCVGWHPDQVPTLNDAIKRAHNAERDAFNQFIGHEKKRLTVYANKSCALCGRTYKADGNLDESWELTAKRVHQEMQNAGLFGVDDAKVKLVVAKCRKAVETLFMNRPQLLLHAQTTGDWMPMQKLTFSGQLAFIITVAQIERKKKMNGTTVRGSLDG